MQGAKGQPNHGQSGPAWLLQRSRQVAAARQALSNGDAQGARRLAAGLVAANPRDAEGHFMMGIAASITGQIQAGIDHIERAVALDPRGEYLAQLAKLLAMARRDGDAAFALQTAEQTPPTDASGQDALGYVNSQLGDFEAALPHHVEAVRLSPHNIGYRYNLAVTLSILGRTGEAETELEALLDLAPGNARAHHLLAGLRKQAPERNNVERIGRALETTYSPQDRLMLTHALAKELEDLGRMDEALERRRLAKAEFRRTLSYSFENDAALFDAVEASWHALAQAEVSDAPTEDTIFIVGMARTGTTLVDRILSSHPEVESAEELHAMPLAVKKAAGTTNRMVSDAETIMAAAGGDLAAIGRDYLDRANHHRRGLKPRFTDKFPGNFLYAGFIARALPSARIVCLRRHPMDTALSNFRNLFGVTSEYYGYTYDLFDIAAYYIRFDRLMAHWREAFPDRLIEVRYEDLVADQAGETARMLEHCGLAWSDNCMAFHTSNVPVSTPSAAQVRRPLYADSIGRWKRHAEVLEPVRQLFEEAGIVLD